MVHNSMLANFKNLLKKGLRLFSREEANSCLELRANVRSPLPLCPVSLTLTLLSQHTPPQGGWPVSEAERTSLPYSWSSQLSEFLSVSSLVTAVQNRPPLMCGRLAAFGVRLLTSRVEISRAPPMNVPRHWQLKPL